MFRQIGIALLLSQAFASAVGQAQTFHEKVLETYSFQPHTLSQDEIDKKSAVLDAFWNAAKTDKDMVLPELRTELGNFSNPKFFLYDGSMLLLSLADTHEDRVIALAAMAQCDLRDLQEKEYFLQVHRLASQGEDVTAAALHVLDDPKFQVVIPEHALTLGQNYALIYLLLPMEEKIWVQPAIQRLEEEKDRVAQKSLLLAIWYAQTAESNKTIAAFATDNSKPEELRKYAQELEKRSGGAVAGTIAVFNGEDSLRKKRRERMRAVSDEALDDLDVYTGELIAKRK